MAQLTAPGIGSGLDVQSILSALMNYERIPLNSLKTRQTAYETQISAYGKLRSTLDSFKTAMTDLKTVDKFQLFKAESSDTTILSATADKTAAAGNYTISVDRLAQRHKMASATGLTSADTFGGSDSTDALNFTINGNAFSVNIYNGGSGMTLTQIRDAVNNDSNNTGVTATVINGTGTEQKLVFTADDSGYDARLNVTVTDATAAGIATTLGLTTINKNSAGNFLTEQVDVDPDNDLDQLDAQVTIDGFAVTRATNSFSDALTGVTLNLTKVGSTTLDVSRDDAAVKEAIGKFNTSFNSVVSKVRELRSGDLKNDSSLRTIESQLRAVLNSGTSTGTYKYLSEIGITSSKDTGQLSLNSTTLTTAMDTNFADVAALFGNTTDGVAKRLYDVAYNLLDTTDGLLSSRTKGLTSRIKSLQAQQTSMEYRLTQVEKRYQTQFSSLDSIMSQMNSTSSYLTAQLANL